MADAIVTLKLSPAEFKLVQTALTVAVTESGAAAQAATAPGAKTQSRKEQAQFSDLLHKLTS